MSDRDLGAVERAIGSLGDALDRADADDPRSIEPVLARVAALRAAASGAALDASRFPDVRARLDQVMSRFQGLIDDLVVIRDGVGRDLARVRRRRRERGRTAPDLGGSRLDLTR
ncbi:MAG: hypothetical protein ACF8XB_20855 [Planctomycetota bacterium JB042]